MSTTLSYPVHDDWEQRAHATESQYHALYQKALSNPDGFWAEYAASFTWHAPWTRIKNTQFERPVHIRWFEDAQLNITENCLDRHLAKYADRIAYYWEGDTPDLQQRLTYQQLYDRVCQLANGLRENGVKKGDRVTLYLPMIPEAVVAMLACARIGAIHSVVFAGFSPDALAQRIHDCDSSVVITADEGRRGGKKVPLKANVDAALADDDRVKHVIVVRNTGSDIHMKPHRDIWYDDVTAHQEAHCAPELMDAEDPLFILYTSGSTGKPKGVLHSTAGYMVWTAITHHYTFDYHHDDIFWCTADVGWVTGHSYIVYGPLLNAASSVIFEGVPNYPDYSRFWQIVDTYRVSIFHTAPTAIRALMREGDDYVTRCDLGSLKLLGSVGEPINPESWQWYHRVVGGGRCPIVDTWWQTETGGHMITPLPGATTLKPGSATLPFFGVLPAILDSDHKVLEGVCEGELCIADSWPGQARSLYGDHQRFEETYFTSHPGYYFTGDGAKRDGDGYYWITGRVDDVLNISGHRLGTAEIESELVGHESVAEAAVVGFPHDIKGQGIYAYVTLMEGVSPSDSLRKTLINWVREHLSPIATPDVIHFTPGLPKTRSGKIMRRILRKIAEGEYAQLGDTSTLTNPECVQELIKERKAR